MNKRERILLFAVLGIVGAYGMFVIVQRAFLGPLETQAAQIRSLNSELNGKRKQMAEAKKASDQLAEWEKISLPGDVDKAQSMYRAYLLDLIRECRFEESNVNPDKIQKDKSGYFRTIPFTIRGKVTVEHLTDFMYRFYQPNMLHQIRNLTVNADPKSKNLSVVITVAALSLDKAPDRSRLIPEGEDKRGLLLAGDPREKFQLISKKNIFEPFRPPAAPPTAPKEPQIDEAEHTRLTACTQSSDEPEAWIFNRIKYVNTVLRAGDEFDIAGVKGKLVSVGSSGIVIERDSKEWTLKLGKTLKDLKEIPKPGLPVASEAKDKSSGNGTSNDSEGEKPTASERTEASGDPEKPADDKPEKTDKDFPKDKPDAEPEAR